MTTNPNPTEVPAKPASIRRPAPTALDVVPWEDPLIDGMGFDPRSVYVEQFWLGILGPSAVWFLRLVARELEKQPSGFRLELEILAQQLGVGLRGGRNAPVHRTIDRLCRFGLVRRGGTSIAVRRMLPPLTTVQVSRLPETLQAAHEHFASSLQAERRLPPTGDAA